MKRNGAPKMMARVFKRLCGAHKKGGTVRAKILETGICDHKAVCLHLFLVLLKAPICLA